VIERFLGRIKRFWHVARRYGKKAVNFVGFVGLAPCMSEVF